MTDIYAPTQSPALLLSTDMFIFNVRCDAKANFILLSKFPPFPGVVCCVMNIDRQSSSGISTCQDSFQHALYYKLDQTLTPPVRLTFCLPFQLGPGATGSCVGLSG